MKEVITRQKYKCDFCKKRGIKTAMEKHERRCFRNPNRYCDSCENKGYYLVGVEHMTYEEPCIYCSKRDPKVEAAIKSYEESLPLKEKK